MPADPVPANGASGAGRGAHRLPVRPPDPLPSRSDVRATAKAVRKRGPQNPAAASRPKAPKSNSGRPSRSSSDPASPPPASSVSSCPPPPPPPLPPPGVDPVLAASLAALGADPDGFQVVTGRRSGKRSRPPQPRPHPAVVAQRVASAAASAGPPPATVLFYPLDGVSLREASQPLLFRQVAALCPNFCGIRRIRKGGVAIDFPADFDLAKVLATDRLANVPVRTLLPRPPAGSLGTIRGSFSSPGELLELYSYYPSNPPVLSAKRIGNSQVWVLQFSQPDLPDKVTVLYGFYRVAPYFSPPLQCFKCHRYGHAAELCRSSVFCGKCGERGHRFKDCPSSSETCVNCAGPHHSRFRLCPHRVFNVRVEKRVAQTRISRAEARRIIANLFYPSEAPSGTPPAAPPAEPPVTTPVVAPEAPPVVLPGPPPEVPPSTSSAPPPVFPAPTNKPSFASTVAAGSFGCPPPVARKGPPPSLSSMDDPYAGQWDDDDFTDYDPVGGDGDVPPDSVLYFVQDVHTELLTREDFSDSQRALLTGLLQKHFPF